MLATQWPRIFAQPDWVYELKWDGVRVIYTWDGSTVRLRSRRGNDATSRYPEVAVPAADRPLVLDGEVVSLDPSGRPSFQQLQQRMNLAGGARIAAARTAVPVVYVVFDVLYDGEEVIAEPWERRRRRLESLDLQFPLEPSTVVDGDPTALWELVKERGLEGIVAKQPNLGVPTGDEVHRVAEDHPLPDGAGGGGRLASRRTGESRHVRVPPPRSVDRPRPAVGRGGGIGVQRRIAGRHTGRPRRDAGRTIAVPARPRDAPQRRLGGTGARGHGAVQGLHRCRTAARPVVQGFHRRPAGSVTWEVEGPAG